MFFIRSTRWLGSWAMAAIQRYGFAETYSKPLLHTPLRIPRDKGD
jgi:hypothetical protein